MRQACDYRQDVEEYGSVIVNVRASVAQYSPPQGLNRAVRLHSRGPLLAQLTVYATLVDCYSACCAFFRLEPSNYVWRDVDAVAALQCASNLGEPSGNALQVLPVPGPPASDLRTFSVSLLRVRLSAASICAVVRMIFERVRWACRARVRLADLPAPASCKFARASS